MCYPQTLSLIKDMAVLWPSFFSYFFSCSVFFLLSSQKRRVLVSALNAPFKCRLFLSRFMSSLSLAFCPLPMPVLFPPAVSLRAVSDSVSYAPLPPGRTPPHPLGGQACCWSLKRLGEVWSCGLRKESVCLWGEGWGVGVHAPGSVLFQ